MPVRSTATLARAWEARPTGREFGAFGLQVAAVAGVDLADEAVRGLLVPQNPVLAQANALRVMDFERAHDLWLEPWLQRGFEQTHHLAGLSIGEPVQVRCDGCPAGLFADVTYIAREPEFTPPVIYSLQSRQTLVYLIEARPSPIRPLGLQPGQIVDVTFSSPRS